MIAKQSKTQRARKAANTAAKISKALVTNANVNRQMVKVADSLVPGGLSAATQLYKAGKQVAKVAMAARKTKAAPVRGQAIITRTPMPTAVMTIAQSNAPNYENLANGNLIMSGTQFLDGFSPQTADFGGANYISDPAAFRIWEFKVNPLESYWPSVLEKATGFERFRIRRYRINFHNTLPTATVSGSICFAYSGDPSAPLPTSFTQASTIPYAKSGSVAGPLSMDMAAIIRDKKQGEGYTNQYIQDRGTNGEYVIDAKANVLLQAPFTVLCIMEGLNGNSTPINADTVLGRISFDYEIELIKTKQADLSMLLGAAGVVDFDTQHTALSVGYGLPFSGPFFTRGLRSLVYRGFGQQGYNFTLDLTLDPSSDPLPTDFALVQSPDGAIVPATTNDFIDAVATDGRRIIHVDGVMQLTRNSRIVFAQGFNWKGSFNVNLIPAKTTLSSPVLD